MFWYSNQVPLLSSYLFHNQYDSYDDFKKEVRDLALDVDGVHTIDELSLHKFGPYYIVNMVIGISGDLSINQGHEISDAVEARLLDHFRTGLRKVHIHYHPITQQKGQV
ncbi:hypothetical protein EOM86_09215 [Candidatus Nomurabacteria bacterium]|nr:hypothetical protein [Candidatus Nomurabacteria bacterium]